MLIERHTNEFSHLLWYHFIPLALVAVFLYLAIFLVIKLATRRGKTVSGKRQKIHATRHQHRRKRAMKKGSER